jgi:hypothetical protein
MENQSLYDQMLNELQNRRIKCLNDLEIIDQAISALRATFEPSPNVMPTDVKEINPYAAISVRWAILKLLYNNALRPLKTAEIADALLEGGNNYASKTNVSAVVSDMVNKRKELEIIDDGYTLTETGKSTWHSIAHSSRYKERSATDSNA